MVPGKKQEVVSTTVEVEHGSLGSVLSNVADIHQASIKIVFHQEAFLFSPLFSRRSVE